MGRQATEPFPATVVPCAAFGMSDRFRDWAVAQMRSEVGGQISGAGLDRMAMVKAKGAGTGGQSGKPPAGTAWARKLTARKRKGSQATPATKPKDPTQR
jgi:hypothetical protein